MLVIPALRRLKQEDQKFKVNLELHSETLSPKQQTKKLSR
jgi:hypothetical protein